jgi:outer membrane protein assembly factor BamB
MMRSLAALLLLCFVCVPVSAQEWPQFRGPSGQGHAGVEGLPLTWSETEHVRWKSAIPGEGHSSPAISGDQIWLTTAMTEQLTDEEQKARLAKIKNPDGLQVVGTLSLRAIQISRESGEIERDIELFRIDQPEPKHSLNSFASPTPVISGDRVVVHFGTYGTAAIACSSGEVLWKNDSLKLDHQNGPGSSPVVWEDLVIIHLDGINTQSIAALDRATGQVRWQTKRSGEMDKTPELTKAYCTPLIVDVNNRPLIISPAANWVYGYDARDGKEVWRAHYGKLGFSTVPRPVLLGDTAFIATSYMQSRLVAVKFTGEGDVTASHVKWISDRQIPQKPSLVAFDGRIYFVSDRGIVRCLDGESGKEIWFERLPGDYSASPLEAEGHLYFFNQDGTCTVLKAGDSYEQLAQNKLDAGFMASPAVAGKALFLRTTSHLYRIENAE